VLLRPALRQERAPWGAGLVPIRDGLLLAYCH